MILDDLGVTPQSQRDFWTNHLFLIQTFKVSIYVCVQYICGPVQG